MIVSNAIPFSQVPVAGVCCIDLSQIFMKLDAASAVDLATGFITAAISPTAPYTYFANARLVLS